MDSRPTFKSHALCSEGLKVEGSVNYPIGDWLDVNEGRASGMLGEAMAMILPHRSEPRLLFVVIFAKNVRKAIIRVNAKRYSSDQWS